MKFAHLLTLAGVLPFTAALVTQVAGASGYGFHPWIEPVAFLRLYGLLIAGFMAGTIWGMEIAARPHAPGGGLLIVSNVLALAALAVTLVPRPIVTILGLMVVFAVLLAVDLRAAERPGWYRRLRLLVSVIVLAHLGAFAMVM